MARPRTPPSSDPSESSLDPSLMALLNPHETMLYDARVSLWNYINNFIAMGVAVLLCIGLIALNTDMLTNLAGDGQGPLGPQRYMAMGYAIDFWQTPWSLLVRFAPLLWVVFNASQVLQGYYSIRLLLTDARVIVSAGIVSQQTVDIPLSKIESLRVFQTVNGKMFNFGSVVIHGVGDSMTVVYGIRDPLTFKKRLQAQQAKVGGSS